MSIKDIKEALFGGIDPNIPGHGGAECAAFLTPKTMLMETMLSTSMMIIVGIVGWFTYTMPSTFPKQANSLAKKFLLVLLCLVFGLEIGYKLCSKELLYLLNPCHVITVIQVCIIISPTIGAMYLSFRTRFTCWLQNQTSCLFPF